MKNKGKRERLLEWAADYSHSALTADQYAAEAGCSVAKLRYWRRQLKDPTEPDTFTELQIVTRPEVQTAPSIYLRLGNEVEVHGPAHELVCFVRQLRADHA